MRKVIIVLLLSLVVVGCSAVTDNPPKPMQVDTPANNTPEVIVNQPKLEQPEEEPEIPIYLEDLSMVMTILEPDSIGTTYIEAT